MEVNSQLHAPATLHPRKNPWYPLDRKLDEPQSWFGHGGEQKNSHPLSELIPPNHSAHSPALYHHRLVSQKIEE